MINIIIKILQRCLELHFLPSKFTNWLFSTGTNAIEFINSLLLIGFSIIVFIDKEKIENTETFESYLPTHPYKIAMVLLIIGILQSLFSIFSRWPRMKVLSGFILLVSAAIWSIVSGTFIVEYPPFATGMITYPVFTFICACAGYNLIRTNKDF